MLCGSVQGGEVDWRNGGMLAGGWGGSNLAAGFGRRWGLVRRWAGQIVLKGQSTARTEGSSRRERQSEVEAQHRDTGSPRRGAGPETEHVIRRSFHEG